METYGWNNPIVVATLILGLVTAVLAFTAFFTILQNRCFNRKERILNKLEKVIDWAVNVKACGLGKDISDIASLPEKQLITHFKAKVSERISPKLCQNNDFIM